MKKTLLALSCILSLQLAAAELPAVVRFRFGIIADGIGSAGIVPVDITGDGRPEILSCSNGAPFALEYRNGDYVQLWYGPSVGCNAVTAGDTNGDGATEVLVTGAKGLFVFDPRGLGNARSSVTLPSSATGYAIAFGNADFDATPEIVVSSNNSSYVYDAATLQLQWTAQGYGGSRVFVADVDGDARNEVIVSSGSILDAGNQTLKWGYLGGFNDLAVGNLDADAKAEIAFIASSSYYGGSNVTVLQGDTMTTSTVTFTDYIMTLAIGDGDGDGANELMAGDDQWGDVSGRRPSDGTLLWTITNPEHGVSAVAAGDVDGDGAAEVLWGAGLTSSGEDALFIANPKTKAIEWRSIDLDGPFSTAVGDLDGDGRIEVVVASTSSRSQYGGSIIKVLDGVTAAETRSISTNWSTYGASVAIAQLDADPAKEIALSTSSNIGVYDGVTGALEWSSPGGASGMAIAQMDGDPVEEIVTIADQKLVVLHGISNIVQSSRVFTNGHVLTAADVTGDGLAEVVASTIGTTDEVYLFSPTLTTIAQKPMTSVYASAATSLGGGRIALRADWDASLVLLDATLTEQWRCAALPNYNVYYALSFGTLGGQARLFIGDAEGTLYAAAFTGSSCPPFDTLAVGTRIANVVAADVTGDGRNDLVVASQNAVAVVLADLPGGTRGDANGDSIVTNDDIDRLADYLLGAGPGLSPMGDANADARLDGQDVFMLIHHRLSGGALPQSP